MRLPARSPNPSFKLTLPLLPKLEMSFPVLASRQYKYSPRPERILLLSPSSQYVTPRFTPREFLSKTGSNFQISFPVAASSAKGLNVAVVPYTIPSTTMGLHWICDRFFTVSASRVEYIQATFKLPTFCLLIWVSEEYGIPSAVPPLIRQVRYVPSEF